MNKYKLTYDEEVIGSDVPERLSITIEADDFEEAYEHFNQYRFSGDTFIKLELIEDEHL